MVNARQAEPLPSAKHEAFCKLCSHAQRETIEREWVNWGNTSKLAKKYGLSRDGLYRHAHATGLFAKRQRNIRAALEKIIEKAGDVEVNAPAVVQAVATYARINSEGRLVDRSERVDLNELFARMSRKELDAYAKDGRLPEWFTATVGATGEGANREQTQETR